MADHLTITTCTNRKRLPPHPLLSASLLGPGAQQDVSFEWRKAVICALRSPSVSSAMDIYCGRSFQEALAASQSSDELWIISAGLGLVAASDQIPSYSLTVVPGARDSVRDRVASFDARDWWNDLSDLPTSKGSIANAVRKSPAAIIILAVSHSYYDLVEADLLDLAGCDLERIRIVGVSPARVDSRLEGMVMPYDERLNGPDSPIPGTRSDFPQRCARHFVGILKTSKTISAARHAREIVALLKEMRVPLTHERRRVSDGEIRDSIRKYWDEVNGQSSKMLRYLRDELGVACEQSRFAKLFHQVRRQGKGQRI